MAVLGIFAQRSADSADGLAEHREQLFADPGRHAWLILDNGEPAGFVGLAYWYLLYPVHHRVFGAMMRGIRKAMEPESSGIRPVVRLLPDDRVR